VFDLARLNVFNVQIMIVVVAIVYLVVVAVDCGIYGRHTKWEMGQHSECQMT